MKPMLAAKCTIEDIKSILQQTYLIGTPKFDGIRCAIDKIPLTRSLKQIPNKHIFKTLSSLPIIDGDDGEITVGNLTDKDLFQQTTSAVMSFEGTPKFTYHVFDKWNSTLASTYKGRQALIHDDIITDTYAIKKVPTTELHTIEDVIAYEEKTLAAGYEGIILRTPNGKYKFGRSTLKEGGLLKLKRFDDSEAKIVKIIEKMHNANEATTNALGYTERSSHKDNMVPMGTFGAFEVRDIHHSWEFCIGTGVDAELGAWIWKNRKALVGRIIKYKYFSVGMKDVPRFPVFMGFRDKLDM